MSQPNVVVFVDDQEHEIIDHMDALKAQGFAVRHFSTAQEGIQSIRASSSEIAVVVIDIMVPTDSRYGDARTSFGLYTGLALYEDIRDQCDRDILVVILTNLLTSLLQNAIDKYRDKPPDARLVILEKPETTYRQLVDTVLQYTGRERRREPRGQ